MNIKAHVAETMRSLKKLQKDHQFTPVDSPQHQQESQEIAVNSMKIEAGFKFLMPIR